MPQQLRLTRTTRAVLEVLRDGFEDDLWGLRVCRLAELPSGTVYPLLTRLEDLGWVETRWEDVGEGAERASGPRRRFYRLTPDGLVQARTALASESTKFTFASLVRPAPAAGGA